MASFSSIINRLSGEDAGEADLTTDHERGIMASRTTASAIRARLLAGLIGAAMLCPPAAANETLSYSYDALGRLVKVSRTGSVNNNATECYAYDAASNRSNVTVSSSSDCGAPSFSISDASATEGATETFTVTRTGPTAGSFTVNYATAPNTASANVDYTTTSGTLTFGSGVTTQTIQVPTIQDTLVEGNETFYVNLSSPSTPATISDGQGVGTIVDDDTASPCTGVSFTIASNGPVTEGTNSVFTVTKTGTATGSCSVNYATSAGTATAGSDYTTTSGTLTFTTSQSSKTVSVPTIDDTIVENPETFSMALSSPTGGATLGTPHSATATINDNDSGTQPPVANPDFASTTACGSVNVNVVANDTDPGGNLPLALTAIVSSTKGTATILTSTTIEYDANVASGTGVVTYTVANTKGATANGTLTVTISGGVCP